MKTSIKPSILVLAILITVMLSSTMAYGQTRTTYNAGGRSGPTRTWAPRQRTIITRAWSGFRISQPQQRQLIQQRMYRNFQPLRFSTFRMR